MKNPEPWYSAKCIFMHKDLSRRQKKPCYEERITLIRARSFKEAIRKGEAEARRYAKRLPETEYLGFISIFHLFGHKVNDCSEIFSVMRSVPVSKKKIIDLHYDDGTFHCKDARDL